MDHKKDYCLIIDKNETSNWPEVDLNMRKIWKNWKARSFFTNNFSRISRNIQLTILLLRETTTPLP